MLRLSEIEYRTRCSQGWCSQPTAGTAKNREARYSPVSDVQAVRDDDTACKAEIRAWARSVHTAWASEHEKVLPVVRRFLATLL
jgi:hypothetical protein